MKPGGRLAFISSNAFARAAYAKRLREYLIQGANLQQFIDLGDTQVFTDAKDVYPAMVLIEKPSDVKPKTTEAVRTIRLRRDDNVTDVGELTKRSGWNVPVAQLRSDGWQFEEPAIVDLRAKLHSGTVALGNHIAGKLYLGIKTGLNEAFVISESKRASLVLADVKSSEVIKPFAGGQDIRRWHCEDSGTFAIVLPSGITAQRSGACDESAGWKWLSESYPAVAEHLEPFAVKGRKRTDKGHFWWELRSCDYYAAFAQPKILYPDIAKSNRFFLDREGLYSSNTTYLLPVGDAFLLGVLNSKAIWFALAGISIPFGERAGEFRYRLFSQYVERLPIPAANESDRVAIAKLAEACMSLGEQRYELETRVQGRLDQTFGQNEAGESLGKLNTKAQAWWERSLNELGTELKKSFHLKANPFKKPQTADEWESYLAEKQSEHTALSQQLADAEAEINDRVYKLFDLTPEEIKLLQREVEP